MMYFEFNVDNKTYKLRLNTRNIVSLEKHLGCNPLGVFGAGDRIPTVTEMIYILHYSLQQYEHGIDLPGTYEIFDKYLDEGNSPTDFINTIVSIYKVSGIIKEKTQEDDSEKN